MSNLVICINASTTFFKISHKLPVWRERQPVSILYNRPLIEQYVPHHSRSFVVKHRER